MSSTTVTGKGDGAIDPPLRMFTNLGWANKMRNLDARQIGDGSVTDTAYESLAGASGNIQDQINAISGVVAPHHVISVSSNATFTSIAAAANSIHDSDTDNRYVIKVSPGTYIEPLIELPSFVFVVGDYIDSVVVKPDAPGHHIFSLSNRSGIQNLTISGSRSGNAGVYAHDVGDFGLLNKVTIEDCYIGILMESDVVDSYVFTEYVDFSECLVHNAKVQSFGTKVSELHAENLYSLTETTIPDDQYLVTGSYANFVVGRGTIVGNAAIVGNGIRVTDGGHLLIEAANFQLFDKGVYSDTTGSDANVVMSGVEFFSCTENFNIENTTTTGYFTGYSDHSKSFIDPDNYLFFVANLDVKTVTVAKSGADHTSIKAAIDSILDAGLNNRYVVSIGAGIFTEDTITMKDYIHVKGTETRGTIVELKSSPTTPDLFLFPVGISFSSLQDCLLRDVPDGACIKYEGGSVGIEHVRFYGTNKYCIDAYNVGLSGTLGNRLHIHNCSTALEYDTPLVLRASDDGSEPLNILVHGFYTNITAAGIESFAQVGITTLPARGINTKVNIMSSCLIGRGDGTGCGVEFADGADVHVMGCLIEDFQEGIHVVDQGDPAEIEATGNLIYDNSDHDIWVEQATTNGTVSGTSDRSQISIASDTVSVLVQGSSDGSLMVSGDYFQGNSFANLTNLTDSMTKGPAAGLISGGGVIRFGASPTLALSVSSGTGYIYSSGDPATSTIKHITWNTTPLDFTSAGAGSYFIIVTYNPLTDPVGDVTFTDTPPSFFSTVTLARVVVADGGSGLDILMLIPVPRLITAISSRFDRLFRYYLGSVYNYGSVATQTDPASLKINVGGGNYAYSQSEFFPSGASPITFSIWYRDPSDSSKYIVLENQTDVPTDFYDREGVGLTELADNTHYAKHLLFIFGGLGGEPEKYFLLYGQQEFDSLAAAETGGLPVVPDFFKLAVTTIASVIVRKTFVVIQEILDERPTLTVRSGEGTTALSNHASLSGLTTTDAGHTQFVMRDGSKKMTNDLDTDGNDIIMGVGLVDGVDVSAHAARHLPGGADALTVAAPTSNLTTTSTNAEGIQNKFARSDHTHAVTTKSDGTVSSIVALNASGNFTAGTITANLTGNVTGDVTGNASGSAATFTTALSGDVTGGANGAVNAVAKVGGALAADVATATTAANNAVSTNTASRIVKRDASGDFSAGVITASFTGALSGNATTATNFTNALTGDVTGGANGASNTVAFVDTSSAANVHSAELLANAATNLNTVSTIVKRDGSGNFTAGTITANLTGGVTGNVSGSAATFTTALTGDVTGGANGGSTTVASVGTSSAANVHSAELAANAATNLNTVSTIVKRDASGAFSAGIISAALTGNVTGSVSGSAATFTTALTGDVTGGANGASNAVAFVGTSSAADVHSAELAANAATNLNTVSTIVKRDGSGNFTAGTITANLTGNASNVTGIVAVANGGTNSNSALANNKLMVSSGSKIVEYATSVTAGRALASDGITGLPVSATTTTAELNYLNGVTSAVQTQLTNNAGAISNHTGNTSNPHTTTLGQALTAGNLMTANIDGQTTNGTDGYRMVNIPDPVSDYDVCNKHYADATASGLLVKDSVVAATTVNLSATYTQLTPGSGVGAYLTATANGVLALDTIAPIATNRVLIKNQTTKTRNGIYVVTDPGVADPGGSPWVLTRAADFDGSPTSEITNGTFVLVSGGATQINEGWVITSTPPITLDTTDIIWSLFSKPNDFIAGDGLLLTDLTFSAKTDGTTLTTSGGNIIIKSGGVGNTQLDKANIPLSGFGVPVADISLNSNKITNLAAPIGNNDAARNIDVSTVQGNLTSHAGSGGANHPAVTTSVNGFMIASDKLKLDAATNANTASAIVRRDGSGDFTAGIITATTFSGALSGNATTATNFTNALTGDVTGGANGASNTVASVGTSSAANVHSAELAANAATNLNTFSTIVKRDAAGAFSAGTITATFSGNLTGGVTGNASGSAATFTTALTGDVTGGANGASNTVAFVDTSSAANVHSAELLANAATNLNTVSTIVKRDGSGNFSAGTISAALTGNVTGNASGSAATFTTALTGDVTGGANGAANAVASVGGSSAANVHSAELAANAATNLNAVSTIVKRDGSGNFTAGTISATTFSGALTGNASGSAATFTTALTGDVTGGANGASNTVASVGGSSAANVHNAELLANAATNLNTVSTIVKRDGSGNFTAGTITAALTGNVTGNVTGNTSGSAATFTTALTGDVTGGANGASNTVASVGGSTATNVHNAELLANAATNLNTVSTIVKRDGSGNFTAGMITANVTGTLTGNATNGVNSASGTAPLTLTLSTGALTGSVSAATTLAAGTMSAADKTKLDGLSGGSSGSSRVTVNNTTTGQSAVDIHTDGNAGTLPYGFSIASGEIWEFKFVIFASCGGAGGVRFGMVAPTGCVLDIGIEGFRASANPWVQWERLTGTGSTVLSVIGYCQGATNHVVIRGIAINSTTAGTVSLQFASMTNTQTSTIIAHSYMVGRTIA